LEATGDYETYGFAGFFAVAIGTKRSTAIMKPINFRSS
jgi:uncharacterized protein YbcC (UPF0753/DUF2309 family)